MVIGVFLKEGSQASLTPCLPSAYDLACHHWLSIEKSLWKCQIINGAFNSVLFVNSYKTSNTMDLTLRTYLLYIDKSTYNKHSKLPRFAFSASLITKSFAQSRNYPGLRRTDCTLSSIRYYTNNENHPSMMQSLGTYIRY